MELVTEENELARRLQRAGYRPEIAEVAREHYRDGAQGCNIETLANVDGQRFWVDFYFHFNVGGRMTVRGLCATPTRQQQWQEFPGLPNAKDVLAKLNINPQNITVMNENNLEYNKNLLEKLGFGKALNDPLEKFIIQQQPEFKLSHEATHFRDNVEYTLHFRKSDTTDMYFFNRYEATLKSNEEAYNRTQSFQVRNGSNSITAQESFNLVSGRAINKEMFSTNGDRYEAWLKLDFSQKDKYGNYGMEQYHQKYNYDLTKALEKFPIKELQDADQKAQLMSSLKKGNMQQVTMERDGKDVKMYIEANPRFRTLNIKDELGNTVKRDKVEKKEMGQNNKLDQALTKDKTQSQKQGKGQSV